MDYREKLQDRFRWHPCSHKKLMENPMFSLLDMSARGVLFTFRLLAGQSNSGGTVVFGTKCLIYDDFVAYVMACSRMSKKCAVDVINLLIKCKYLDKNRYGVLSVVGWEEEMSMARSKEAERKRKYRERKKSKNANKTDEFEADDENGGASESAGKEERDMHGTQTGHRRDVSHKKMGHVPTETEYRDREETSVSQNTETEEEKTEEVFGMGILAESTWAVNGDSAGISKEDVWNSSDRRLPALAAKICGESTTAGSLPMNTWRRRYDEMLALCGSSSLFRESLCALLNVMAEGGVRTTKARVLDGIFKENKRNWAKNVDKRPAGSP